MPKSPEREGSPRLMTINEIAEEHGVSRQSVHTYRRRGIFPKAVEGEGSTRPRFREDEVDAFFAANPKRPGKRTARPAATQGEPMPDLIDFLQARLAEDERAAYNSADFGGGINGFGWRVSGSHEDEGGTYWSVTAVAVASGHEQAVEVVGSGMSGGGAHTEQVAHHIVRHDPARELREVKAKRRIVEQFTMIELPEQTDGDTAVVGAYVKMQAVLRLMALPYAAHPDYRPEWAPTT